MRKIGYYYSPKKNSFVRPLSGKEYPRFHIFVETDEKENKIIFNLHLDQKKPTYKGFTAHSAEYEGSIVKEEAQRIKQILNYK